jgi:O-antigen/teichoic acid export membrane protein
MVALSIISGVQDGIIQGFEDFRAVALVRLTTTAFTLICVYPAGMVAGLPGVMATVLAGLVIKSALLTIRQRWHVKTEHLPARGSGLSIKDMLWGFSIPSMLASTMSGTIGWLGSVMLSRQAGGFDGLAVVSTGLQWCGPVLLISSTVSSVAIPAISRHYHRLDHAAIQKLLTRMLLFNGAFATLVSAALVAGSHVILGLYGPGFVGGSIVFSLLVVSSVPQVIAGVYIQNLVAKGQMWEQALMYLCLVIPLALGYATLVPRYHGVGFAWTQLTAWGSFAVALAMTHAMSERQRGATLRVSLDGEVSGCIPYGERPKTSS